MCSLALLLDDLDLDRRERLLALELAQLVVDLVDLRSGTVS